MAKKSSFTGRPRKGFALAVTLTITLFLTLSLAGLALSGEPATPTSACESGS